MSNEKRSLCEGCALRREVWAEKYQEEGYNGCTMLLEAHCRIGEDDVWNYIEENTDGDVLGLGWIRAGIGLVNYQLIIRNVTACLKRREK